MLAGKTLGTKGRATGSRQGRSCANLLRPGSRTLVCMAQPPTSKTPTLTTPKADETFEVRDSEGRLVRRGPMTAADIRDHSSMFSSLLKEYAYIVDDSWVTGTIPRELYGTYYRNGPGLQVSNPRYRRHTFDGDGMVLSLAFRNGKAYFRNRFIRTEGFVKEQAAGRLLYRSSFTRGSPDGAPWFNPFDLSFKNVANTGVLAWAGQLYALWEGGLPYSMDPHTLDTLGETRMGGALRGSNFGAHYRVVSEPDGSRRWVAFSTGVGFSGSAITFYEFAEDGAVLHKTTHTLEGTSLAFIHDILVSEHYYIVLLGPVEFDASKFATSYILSRCSIAECLVYNPAKPARVVLVPRPGRPSGRVLSPRVLETAPCFSFHHVNAFEVERQQPPPASPPSPSSPPSPGSQQGGGNGGGGGGDGDQRRRRHGQVPPPLVVLDTVAWDEVSFSTNQYNYGPEYYRGATRSHLLRMVCDPVSGIVTTHRLLRRTAEFPITDPRVTGRPHRIMWAGCDMVDDPLVWGPIQAILRLEVDPRVGLTATAAGGSAGTPGSSPQRQQGVVSEGVAVDVWYAGERCFPGEPMFVPRPGSSREGDGWLLVVVHNAAAQKGEVVILDAQDLSGGPLATLHLPHRLPAGLHGSWHAAFEGPEDEPGVGTGATPRWQELGTIRAL